MDAVHWRSSLIGKARNVTNKGEPSGPPRATNDPKAASRSVLGVANDHSIAWAIAKQLADQGAELAFTYQGERVEKNAVFTLAATSERSSGLPTTVDEKRAGLSLLVARGLIASLPINQATADTNASTPVN